MLPARAENIEISSFEVVIKSSAGTVSSAEAAVAAKLIMALKFSNVLVTSRTALRIIAGMEISFSVLQGLSQITVQQKNSLRPSLHVFLADLVDQIEITNVQETSIEQLEL